MKANTKTLSLFLQVGRMIRSHMEGALPLPIAQCEMLTFVAERGSPTMHDIARNFKIAAPSATSMVDSLVRGKLLLRVRDEHDRRAVHITLTPKGKTASAAITKRRKTVLSSVLRVLGSAEQRELNRILSHLLVKHNFI